MGERALEDELSKLTIVENETVEESKKQCRHVKSINIVKLRKNLAKTSKVCKTCSQENVNKS